MTRDEKRLAAAVAAFCAASDEMVSIMNESDVYLTGTQIKAMCEAQRNALHEISLCTKG